MIIEYISNKDTYRDKLKKLALPTSVDVRVRKANGQNYYVLRLKTETSSLEDAKLLSNARDMVEELLKEDHVSFKILLNGAAQLLVNELYPLMCEYETKLRKFIHLTLFDISEAAQRIVLEQLKKANKNIKVESFNRDFLEYADIGDIFAFLFANDNLYDDVDKYRKNQANRCATRAELIAYIQNSEKKTIWERFFVEEFADSILPETIWEIKNYRNDVMHFHNITYDTYEKALELVKQGIRDLDKQIKKGIVLEENEENVATLSTHPNYSNGLLYRNPAMLNKLIGVQANLGSWDSIYTAVSRLNNIIPCSIRNVSGDGYVDVAQLSSTLGLIPWQDGCVWRGVFPRTQTEFIIDGVGDNEESENVTFGVTGEMGTESNPVNEDIGENC